MKVLAIGATGFIGLPAVRAIVERGHEVAVLHRSASAVGLPDGVRQLSGDRNRLDRSKRDIERFAPDVVLDVIPFTERQARGLVHALGGRAGRVVALSSADVYRNYDGLRRRATAPPDPAPLAEDAPLRETRYPYRGSGAVFEYAGDYEKIFVERTLMRAADLPVTILRLPAVYGPGDRPRRVRAYLERMDPANSTIRLAPGQALWQWTRGFVDDVAAAIALAVGDARASGRVYNVGEETAPTERDWIARIGAAAGWRGAIVESPAVEGAGDAAPAFDWRYHLWIDTARIRRELGYVEPVPVVEAMRRTVEWDRSQR